MRSDAAFFERVAELHAEETRSRIAGDLGIIFVHQPADHGRIFVEQRRIDREIVVVDDGIDAFSQRRDAVRDDLPDVLDVGFVAQREAFQIDEEMIRRLVVGEALFERMLSMSSRKPMVAREKCVHP